MHQTHVQKPTLSSKESNIHAILDVLYVIEFKMYIGIIIIVNL